MDSVEFNQAVLPRDNAININAARGHDTILSLCALVACSIDIDARMDLRRQLSALPYQEEVMWRTREAWPCPRQHKGSHALFWVSDVRFRDQKRSSRESVHLSVSGPRPIDERDREIHLGTSRMVLANGTVVAVNKHKA